MLLNVWDNWWSNMSRLRAEEERSYFIITQAADAGWKMDRDGLIRHWENLTAPRLSPQPTKDLKGQMTRFADWMMAGFGTFGKWITRDDRG